MEDGTARYGGAEHFFQAEGLGAELSIVVLPLATFAELELDRNKLLILMLFHDVALAIQAEPFGPDRQRAQERESLDDVIARQVRVLVDDVTTVGVLIGRAPALDELQCRPARAVEVVVEEREGDHLSLLAGFQIWNFRFQTRVTEVQTLFGQPLVMEAHLPYSR